MANEALDAFLADIAAQEPAQPPKAQTPPESPAKPEAAPATSTAPATGATGTSGAKGKGTTAPDYDAEPPAPQLGEAVVPRRALEDERHKRQDWKERAVKAETQHAELMRQLDEAKKAP